MFAPSRTAGFELSTTTHAARGVLRCVRGVRYHSHFKAVCHRRKSRTTDHRRTTRLNCTRVCEAARYLHPARQDHTRTVSHRYVEYSKEIFDTKTLLAPRSYVLVLWARASGFRHACQHPLPTNETLRIKGPADTAVSSPASAGLRRSSSRSCLAASFIRVGRDDLRRALLWCPAALLWCPAALLWCPAALRWCPAAG